MDKGSNKTIYIIIGVLALVALLLGFFVMGGPDLMNSTDNDADDRQAGEYASDPDDVLSFPGPDASDEEKQAHSELVFSMAQDTDVINITQCEADPVVARMAVGGSVTFKNSDDGAHVIRMLGADYEVAANSEILVTPDFSNGTGVYGYGCDSVPGGAGLFAAI